MSFGFGGTGSFGQCGKTAVGSYRLYAVLESR